MFPIIFNLFGCFLFSWLLSRFGLVSINQEFRLSLAFFACSFLFFGILARLLTCIVPDCFNHFGYFCFLGCFRGLDLSQPRIYAVFRLPSCLPTSRRVGSFSNLGLSQFFGECLPSTLVSSQRLCVWEVFSSSGDFLLDLKYSRELFLLGISFILSFSPFCWGK